MRIHEEKMKLYTSSFRNVLPGFSQVCIALYPPGSFHGRHLPRLAPTPMLLADYRNHRVDQNGYRTRFNRQLNALHFPDVIKHLHDGDVLLCYEAPGQFCHRHLVAKWLRKHGVESVEEL